MELQQATFAQTSCNVDGHCLAVLDGRGSSQRTPVVFLHGITLSVNFWPAAMRAEWLAELPWISLSLPGHYPSEVPVDFREEDVTPEWFANLIAGAIRELTGGRPVHLIGWSTGGFAALCTAALHSDLTASVVSISGYADGHWTGFMGRLQRIARWPVVGPQFFRCLLDTSRRSRWLFDQMMRQPAGDRAAFRRFERLDQTFSVVHHDYRRHDVDVLCALFRRLRGVNAHEIVSHITCPALIVGGTRDPLIRPSATRELAAAVPHSELELLDGIGHQFFAECPERIERRLTEWLSRPG